MMQTVKTIERLHYLIIWYEDCSNYPRLASWPVLLPYILLMKSNTTISAEAILYGKLAPSSIAGSHSSDDRWWWPQQGVNLRGLDMEVWFEDLDGWSGAGGWMVRLPSLPMHWKSHAVVDPLVNRSEAARKLLDRLQKHQLFDSRAAIEQLTRECNFEELWDPAWIQVELPGAPQPHPIFPRRKVLANSLAAVETLSGKGGRWRHIYLDLNPEQIHQLLYVVEDNTLGSVAINRSLIYPPPETS